MKRTHTGDLFDRLLFPPFDVPHARRNRDRISRFDYSHGHTFWRIPHENELASLENLDVHRSGVPVRAYGGPGRSAIPIEKWARLSWWPDRVSHCISRNARARSPACRIRWSIRSCGLWKRGLGCRLRTPDHRPNCEKKKRLHQVPDRIVTTERFCCSLIVGYLNSNCSRLAL